MSRVKARLEGVTPKLALLAVTYGAVAGLIAILTFSGMQWLQHIVWSSNGVLGERSPIQIATTILIGGALLLLISRIAPTEDLATVLKQAGDPGNLPRRAVLTTALAAIVAVAFGGAVGPEAGIIAVVAQLSAIVSRVISRDAATQRAIGQAGNAGALGGFYASPPGAVVVDGDDLGPQNVLQLAAGCAGFLVFMGVARLTSEGGATFTVPVTDNANLHWGLLVVAVAAAAAGLLFRVVHHGMERAVARVQPWVATAVGTIILAALAAALPLVRFSGHHELGDLEVLTADGALSMLVLVAVAKIGALALCLVSGWRGGEFFPLVFIGAALGSAISLVVPGLDLGMAMATGMAATAAVGWQKPLAVLLILVLLVESPVALALVIGVSVAFVVGLLVPQGEGSKQGGRAPKQGEGSNHGPKHTRRGPKRDSGGKKGSLA